MDLTWQVEEGWRIFDPLLQSHWLSKLQLGMVSEKTCVDCVAVLLRDVRCYCVLVAIHKLGKVCRFYRKLNIIELFHHVSPFVSLIPT